MPSLRILIRFIVLNLLAFELPKGSKILEALKKSVIHILVAAMMILKMDTQTFSFKFKFLDWQLCFSFFPQESKESSRCIFRWREFWIGGSESR